MVRDSSTYNYFLQSAELLTIQLIVSLTLASRPANAVFERNCANILDLHKAVLVLSMAMTCPLTSFKEMLGKLVSGQVIAIDDQENTFVEIQDIRAVLPLKNRIKGEKFKVNDTISCIVKFVRFQKDGLYVELSRTTPKMLEALLEQEVPEIKDGEVIIQKCARIPGDRAKVALFSTSPRIDPIGSSVGTKGVRINAVSRKLNGENIDCIEYSEIPEIFISKALAPAQIIAVKILSNTEEEKKAQVSIMSDQKSKAIGKNGVNIRLACMLTGFEIELVEIIKEKSQEDVESNKEEQKVGIDALESLFKA